MRRCLFDELALLNPSILLTVLWVLTFYFSHLFLNLSIMDEMLDLNNVKSTTTTTKCVYCLGGYSTDDLIYFLVWMDGGISAFILI